jgi:subtilisin family serine protease
MEDPAGIGFGLVGVAPEASIYMYRVFSCYGVGTTDVILAAMQRAADDGVDIISMSLSVGPDGDWPTELNDPLRQTTAGLTQKGIAVIAAQGNEGSHGVNTDSTPAIGVDVIAVGSIANTYFPVTYTGTDTKGRSFKYASVWPINRTEELDVVILTCDGSFGCTDDQLNDALSKVDVNNTMVLVSGALAKYAPYNDVNINYFGVLNDVSNPDPWANEYDLCPLQSYPTHLISIGGPDGQDSKKILDGYMESGGYGKYKLKFGNCTGLSVKQSLTGGTMSNYSTFGPALDTWGMKPEISAPGGNILSTWPLGPLGGYSIASGTSMATPFVAGCYALVKSQFPNLSVDAITVLLQSTSRPVPTVLDKNLLSTTVHQGAGLVNPYRAISYQSTVYPGELNIGSEDDFLGHPKNITITNKSTRSKRYVLGHQGAGYVEAFPYPDLLDYDTWYSYGQPEYPNFGSASFSATSITIPPGQSRVTCYGRHIAKSLFHGLHHGYQQRRPVPRSICRPSILSRRRRDLQYQDTTRGTTALRNIQSTCQL